MKQSEHFKKFYEKKGGGAMKPIEPFGFFRAEPFGWTNCAETDDGAAPLYDQAAIDGLVKQRDELLAALDECRLALEPYDDIKPRDWSTDRQRLAMAHQKARSAIASVKGGTP